MKNVMIVLGIVTILVSSMTVVYGQAEGNENGSSRLWESRKKTGPTFKVVFSRGVFQIGDFSVAFSSVHRQENRTDLQFAITKVKNTGLEIEPITVTLTDDHNNHYRGKLEITPYSGFPLHLLPVDFTYVKTASIVMPKPAPTETIQLEDTQEIAFKKLKLVKPQFKSDFGTALLRTGKPTPVGEFLFFITNGIVPDLYTWSVAATIENKDYNELRSGILCAVQFTDGNIAPPTKPEILVVPGLSKKTTRLRLASLQGIQIPKVRTLLISYHEWRSNQTVLKLWTMSDKDFPPRVGQGTNEEIFVETYQRNSGRELMRDPIALPHWYAGNTEPKDEFDVLVQEFPTSVIVWDKQKHASKAYVLYGPVLKKYQEAENYRNLGPPIDDPKVWQSRFGTKGIYGSFENGMITFRTRQTLIVMGKIYKRWKKENFIRGLLGFPVGDEKEVASGVQGSQMGGWVQRFEGGSIYYCTDREQAGQSFAISGSVDELYSVKMQGSSSWLGFPISECYKGPETGYEQCDFESGYIGTSDGKTFQAFHYEPGMIAFVSDRDGNREIYVTDASGRKQTNLTKNPADDYSPAWSPDGQKILFVSNRQPAGIYVMNTDGSEQRFLAEGLYPSWFPDGSKIAFVREIEFKKNYKFDRIFLMNADGTGQIPFAFFPKMWEKNVTDVSYPTISPDGEKIAFVIEYYGSPSGYIHVAKLDGSELKEFSFGYRASWSFDSGWIASRQDSSIAIQSLDGVTKLPDIQCGSLSLWANMFSGRKYTQIAWAPGDTAIVFSGRKQGEGADIYIAPLRANVLRKITGGKANNYGPSWTTGKQEGKIKLVSKKQTVSKQAKEFPTYIQERSGKQELIAALEDLQSAMIKKIYLEVDITAQSFTSVKEYRRAKLLADVLRPVLRVLQGTLSVVSKIGDAATLSGQVKTSLDNAQYVSEAASLFFMVNGLRESGEKLYYAIDDTAGYVRTVKDMLQAADQTTVIRMDPRAYKQVIKQYLDSEQGTPLVIARTSELAPDKKPAKGALVLYKTIREEFRTLIEQIQRSELPQDFPLQDAVAEIEQLKHQIVEAGVHNIDVHYSIYHQGRKVHQSRKLGAVAEHNKAFAQVAGALAKRLDIEIYAECAQLAATGADAAYIVTYKVPGAGEAVKMTQQVSLLPQIVIEGKKMFTVDPEEQFYQMPQEMLFSLAIEFSSLLRIADDTVLSLTELLKETRSQVPPGEVRPAPTSTKQKEPAKQIEKQVEEAVKSLFKELLRKKR